MYEIDFELQLGLISISSNKSYSLRFTIFSGTKQRLAFSVN